MLNPLNLFSKFIKSSNQRELDRIEKIVQKINSLEDSTKKLVDSDFPKKTLEARLLRSFEEGFVTSSIGEKFLA